MNVEDLKSEVFDTLNESSKDFVQACYCGDIRLCDAFFEFADGHCDIYNIDLFRWAGDNVFRCNEALAEFGTCNDDIMRVIQTAQMMQTQTELDEDAAKIKQYLAYDFLDEKGVKTLSENQVEKLENFLDGNDNLSVKDIENFCNELTKKTRQKQ